MCQLSVVRGVFKAEYSEKKNAQKRTCFAIQEEKLAANNGERGRQCVEEEIESSFSGIVRYRCKLLMRGNF